MIDLAHEYIKKAIEGIGSKFNNLEDLQQAVLDRLAGEPEISKVFVEIIFKAEQIKEQNVPISALLRDTRARVMQERLSIEKDRLRVLLGINKNDGEQSELSSKIVKLKRLETIILPAARSEEELNNVKDQIKEALL
jgi:hypothetical protein